MLADTVVLSAPLRIYSPGCIGLLNSLSTYTVLPTLVDFSVIRSLGSEKDKK
jgi:hypothetical protein